MQVMLDSGRRNEGSCLCTSFDGLLLLPLQHSFYRPSCPRLTARARLAVPSYQGPATETWKGWQAQGPAAVGIMIVNLSGGEDQTCYPDVDDAIRNARKQGIQVLGYTYTSYGARD